MSNSVMSRARRLRRWHRVLGIAVIVGLAAAVGGFAADWWASARPVVYSSTAVLMVALPEASGADAVVRLQTRQHLAATYASLAATPGAILEVATDLGIEATDASGSRLASARVDRDAGFVMITARDTDPAIAASLAGGLADRVRSIATAADGSPLLTLVEPAAPATDPVGRAVSLRVAIGAAAAGVFLLALVVRRRGPTREQPEPAAADAPPPRTLPIVAVVAGAGLAIVVLLALGLELPAAAILVPYAAGVLLAAAVPAAGFAFLAFLLPQYDPALFGAFGLKLPVIAALAYGCGVRFLSGRIRVTVRPGLVLAAGYLAIGLLSAVPMLNGQGGERAVAAAAGFLQLGGGVAVLMMAGWYFRERDPRPIVWAVVASCALAGVLGVMHLIPAARLPLAGLFPEEAAGITRVTGPFENPNYYGLFLAMALTLTFGLAAEPIRRRGLMAVALVPIAMGLVATLSRGALASAAAGIVAASWLRDRRLGIVTAVLVLVAGAASYSLVLDIRLGDSPLGGVGVAQYGQVGSDAERAGSVLAGLDLWAEDVVFGVGFAQYEHESPRYVGAAFATSAHNQYLKLLAEQGVVGAALLLGAVGALVATLRRHGTPLARAALIMLVTYAVGGLSLEPLTTLQTSGVLWLVVGIAAGGAQWHERAVTRRPAEAPSVRTRATSPA